MQATRTENESLRENFAAELAEEAFRVVSRHAVRGQSIAGELELWKALIARTPTPDAVSTRKAELVADLTDTAYQVTLQRGIRGSFLDLQLDLWRTVCQTLRQGRFGAPFCQSLPQAGEPLESGCASNP